MSLSRSSRLLACLLPALACTPASFAYLGGFEPSDGYTFSSLGNATTGPFAEALFGTSGPEVYRYNAGGSGPLAAYAGTFADPTHPTAPTRIVSDPRRWTSSSETATGWYTLYGEGAPRDRTYVNAHFVPAVLQSSQYGTQVLAFRSGDLDVASSLPPAPLGGAAVTYRPDSLDFGGYENTPAALSNRRIDFSFAINYAGWVTQFPSTNLVADQFLLSSVNNDASLMEIDLGGVPNPGANYAAIQGTFGIRLRFYDNQRIDVVHGNGSGSAGEVVTRFQDADGDLRANWLGWTIISGFLDLQSDTFSVTVETTASPNPNATVSSLLTAGNGPFNNAGTSTATGSLRDALNTFGNITIAGREDPDGGGVFKNYIDNFTLISTVPEPGSFAAIAGLMALVVSSLRRRR